MRSYQLMMFLRLLVVIPLLVFSHKGMAREFAYVGEGGGGVIASETVPATNGGKMPSTSATISVPQTSATVPNSNSNVPPLGNADAGAAVKKFAGNINDLGEMVGAVNEKGGNSANAAGNFFKTVAESGECVDGKTESCAKALESATKTAISAASVASNAVPESIKVIPTVIDMKNDSNDAMNAFYRGDSDEGVTKIMEFTQKSVGIGLAAASAPAAVAYAYGTGVGIVINKMERPDGKQGGMGDYLGDKVWDAGESVYYKLNPEKDPMSPEFEANAKLQAFEKIKKQNVQLKQQAEIKKEAEGVKQQSAAQQSNQGYQELVGAIMSGIVLGQQIKAQNNSIPSKSTSSGSGTKSYQDPCANPTDYVGHFNCTHSGVAK